MIKITGLSIKVVGNKINYFHDRATVILRTFLHIMLLYSKT